MLSTAAKRFITAIMAAVAIGWTMPVVAVNAETGTVVVAKLYKDFAWQAMATQADLFGEGLTHQPKSVLAKYFSPLLVDLLIKDSACQAKYQGICNLDFDLLFDSQDPRVTDLEITMASPGKITVIYKDPVDERKTSIEYEVAQIAGTWKITDVIYRKPEKVSLKKVLSRKVP